MNSDRDDTTGLLKEAAPDTETHRWCPECNDYLPKARFYRDSRTKSGLVRRCKDHHSSKSYESRKKKIPEDRHERYNYHRELNLRRFGLTLEEYEAMTIAQGHKCFICKKPETVERNGHLRPLSVDHDHESNQVRKLLCVSCNSGLGLFGDDPELLLAAYMYLRIYKGAPL